MKIKEKIMRHADTICMVGMTCTFAMAVLGNYILTYKILMSIMYVLYMLLMLTRLIRDRKYKVQ